MKKTVYQVIMAVFVLAAVLVAGCDNIANGDNPFSPASYTARPEGAFPHGTVSINPTNAAEGTTVTITVAPDPGYRLKAGSLKVNGSAAGITPGQGANTYTFVMPASNVTVQAEFEPLPPGTYSITIDSENIANGSITAKVEGTETTTATAGAEVTLAISPESHYRLAETDGLTVTHTEDGTPVSLSGSGNTRTFTMPAANVTVQAKFEALPAEAHSVSVPSGITTDKTNAATYETVTLTIAPATGYQYDTDSLTVTKDGGDTVDVVGSYPTFTFDMPDDDVTVTATFTPIPYNITLPDPVNGNSITSNPAGTATVNTTVTLTATLAPGYQLESVTVTKTSDSTEVTLEGSGNTRTFLMPASDVTVTAQFEPVHTYTLTIAAMQNGTVTAKVGSTTVSSGQTVEANVTVTLTVAPNSGYLLKADSLKVNVGAVSINGSGPYTFTMPASNVTVTAEFEKATVLAAGLYVLTDGEPGEVQTPPGTGTMLANAFVWIKNSGSNGGNYLIVLNTDETEATADGYGIGAGLSSFAKSTGSKTGLTITLKGAPQSGKETVTIEKTVSGSLFTVCGSTSPDSAHLILDENITLKGFSGNRRPLVKIGNGTNKGSLTMLTGSKITGNINTNDNGGGVYIDSYGTFTMQGGSIEKNETSFSMASYALGGAIYCKGGTFTMAGGVIAGNSANNSAVISLLENATFSKTGGTIYGKEAGVNNANTGNHVIVAGTNWRDSTANETTNTGTAGFWENNN